MVNEPSVFEPLKFYCIYFTNKHGRLTYRGGLIRACFLALTTKIHGYTFRIKQLPYLFFIFFITVNIFESLLLSLQNVYLKKALSTIEANSSDNIIP